MWEDDRLWLPRMLDGESFSGFFVFDGESMVSHQVTWGTDGWGRLDGLP